MIPASGPKHASAGPEGHPKKKRPAQPPGVLLFSFLFSFLFKLPLTASEVLDAELDIALETSAAELTIAAHKLRGDGKALLRRDA